MNRTDWVSKIFRLINFASGRSLAGPTGWLVRWPGGRILLSGQHGKNWSFSGFLRSGRKLLPPIDRRELIFIWSPPKVGLTTTRYVLYGRGKNLPPEQWLFFVRFRSSRSRRLKVYPPLRGWFFFLLCSFFSKIGIGFAGWGKQLRIRRKFGLVGVCWSGFYLAGNRYGEMYLRHLFFLFFCRTRFCELCGQVHKMAICWTRMTSCGDYSSGKVCF